MLRGPVHTTTLPSLGDMSFPREAGTSGHVYPFPAARAASPAPSLSHPDGSGGGPFRLPAAASIASATFWRSPYSREALRQTRTPPRMSRGGGVVGDCGGQSAAASSHLSCGAIPEDGQRSGPQAAKAAGTGGPSSSSAGGRCRTKEGGNDAGRGVCSEVTGGGGDSSTLQLRGILCKSSLSSSSRVSGAKVQKRVKFEDSVDKGPSPRVSQSASCGRTSCRQDPGNQAPSYRALSASLTAAKSTVHMPSLRPAQQPEEPEKNAPSPIPSPSPSLLPNPHHYPHIPTSRAAGGVGGSLEVCSSSELAVLPRSVAAAKHGGQSYAAHGVPHSCASLGPGSTSSRLSPTAMTAALDFRVYRQTPRANEDYGPGCHSPPLQRRGRLFAAVPGGQGSGRTLVRLTRSFTSPAITLPRPVKRPVPLSSSTNEDPSPTTPPPSRAGGSSGGQGDSVDRGVTARDVMRAVQRQQEETDAGKGRQDQSFLDDAKTVQILHWLQEVGSRQAREGRCPVFVPASSFRDV